IRERGAARVTGIDQSHGMIELARTQEAQHRLGIEYIVGDARELPVTRQFDLVMAAYLLNYAQDPQELQAMYDGLARSLRPAGRPIRHRQWQPDPDVSVGSVLSEVWIRDERARAMAGGRADHRTFYLHDGSFEIENYHLSSTTHETACRLAGFREIRWHPVEL